MRRNRQSLSIGFAAFIALVGLGTLQFVTHKVTPASAESAPTEEDYQVPQEEFSTPVSTAVSTPFYDPAEEVSKVVAWGEVATNKAGSATLVAKQAVEGPIPNTQQITFDLCAIREIPLPDTGMVDMLMLMGNAVPDGTTPPNPDDHNPQYPNGNILIDNTNTVVREDQFGGLGRYLPAGSCANVTVVSPDYDMETAFLGFASYQTSSGVHLEGEFTRITPGGAVSILAHEP